MSLMAATRNGAASPVWSGGDAAIESGFGRVDEICRGSNQLL